ncbi:2OG-Fe(II) oxygenase [Sphingomonas sp. URHD0057]|uniref:2OG-Fe(II) oxygenase n=1 Tax=Sphingomonas sp. URHD0057 TaxID=1380389 RepID=UPI00048FEF40|nr:2OG-Fe(II) oxygenase [Sphingomonas sp. URHD0057]
MTDLAGFNCEAVRDGLDGRGFHIIPGLIAPDACESLSAGYESDQYRSTIVMARHGFGRGEYKYYRYPLPPLIAELRPMLYERLVPIANGWQEALGSPIRYPDRHEDFLARCRATGQTRPTPLILRYGPGDYNCLHQDVYGGSLFPLQVAVLLSDPAQFSGGEFILTEQRPRRQSLARVVPLGQGDAVIFPVRDRPVRGSRGYYRAQHRHGVSEIRSGSRHTLGIIFHDAA